MKQICSLWKCVGFHYGRWRWHKKNNWIRAFTHARQQHPPVCECHLPGMHSCTRTAEWQDSLKWCFSRRTSTFASDVMFRAKSRLLSTLSIPRLKPCHKKMFHVCVSSFHAGFVVCSLEQLSNSVLVVPFLPSHSIFTQSCWYCRDSRHWPQICSITKPLSTTILGVLGRWMV